MDRELGEKRRDEGGVVACFGDFSVDGGWVVDEQYGGVKVCLERPGGQFRLEPPLKHLCKSAE